MDFLLNGIKIKINFLFLAGCAFILLVDKTTMATYSFFAVIIHEVSHFIAMIIINTKPDMVSLTFSGIGVCHNFSKLSYKKELFVVAAGSFVNIALFLVFSFFQNANPVLFQTIAIPNLVIGIFNLLPVSITDGGRVLRIFLRLQIRDLDVADKISFIFSLVFLSFMVMVSFYILIISGYNMSMLVTTIYLIFMLFKI